MVRNISKFVSLSAALVLFACAGILFTGCSNSHNGKGGVDIVGVWKDQSTNGAERYSCFTSEGKFYGASKKAGILVVKEVLEYSVSGNKVKLAGNEYKYGITGDILKIEIDGSWETFKRVLSPTEKEIKKAVKKP